MSNPQCSWPGKRQGYTFQILNMNSTWFQVPGVYIFTKQINEAQWQALYVGQTGNFNTRMTINHEEWAKALRLGATHVHALVVNGGEAARKAVESDLILNLDPPLNQKLSVGLRTLLST